MSVVGCIMIDKLEFTIRDKLSMKMLDERLRMLRIRTQSAKLEGKGGYTLIGLKDKGIYVRSSYATDMIYEVSTNPSRFDSFKEFLEKLESVFDPIVLSRMIVKRMDVAIDLHVPYSVIRKGLYIGAKRKCTSYHENGQFTGMYIGTGSDFFRIYDKHFESKKRKHVKTVNDPTTRIEVQYKNDKLPIKSIYDLAEMSFTGDLSALTRNFEKIMINQIDFVEGSSVESTKLKYFLGFKCFVEASSFQEARKSLNKGNNFNRTYGKYFSLTSIANATEEIQKSLERYFYSWRQSESIVLRPVF